MSHLPENPNGITRCVNNDTCFVTADLVAKLAGVQLAQACKIIAALDVLSSVAPIAGLVSTQALPTAAPDEHRRAITEDAYEWLSAHENPTVCAKLYTLSWVNNNIKKAISGK